MPMSRFARHGLSHVAITTVLSRGYACDFAAWLNSYGRPTGRPDRHGAPPFDLRCSVSPCHAVSSVTSDSGESLTARRQSG